MICAEVAEDQLGLDALVEVHTSIEMRRALNAGARIIGVNNRNLQTFQVSLETSERLIAEAPRDRIMISESGLQDAESLRRPRYAWLPRFSHWRNADARDRSGKSASRSNPCGIKGGRRTAPWLQVIRASALIRHSSFELRLFSL